MFQYETQVADGKAIIRLIGELDTYAAQTFDTFIEGFVERKPDRLVLDFKDLAYMNSSGLRSFLRLHNLLCETGGTFSIRGVSPKVMRVFRYGSLDDYFTFEDA